MNIKRILRGTFRRITPNVMGALPVTEMTVKKRTRLPEPVVRFLATAASVALLLGACWGGYAYFRALYDGPLFHGSHSTLTDPFGTTGKPTNPTETQKPTDPPKPTETTPPTTDPLPTDPVYDMMWKEYNKHPDTYTVFRFSGDHEILYPGKAYDTSNMIEGAFYAVDDGDVYLITEEYVINWFVTSEHIYYIKKDDAAKVYRTDHCGGNLTVIFESENGSINCLQYFGTNSNGKLLMTEDQDQLITSESKEQIIMYDIRTGETEVLMEVHEIGQFHYYPYSVLFDRVVEQISEEDLGPTIYWKGYIADNDVNGTYYYFVETGEHWDITTWEPVDPLVTISDGKYDVHPDSVTVWIYSPDDQWYFDKYELNASECLEGYLYVFDMETGEPTLICDEQVAMFDANYEHIYYVTEQDRDTVIRCDYDGQNKVTFDMGITITDLDYFGGWNGDLGLVDNYTDIIIYDLEQRSQNVIFTYHDVTGVWYASWEGGHIEFDTSTEGYYFCDLETGEMWQDNFENDFSQ